MSTQVIGNQRVIPHASGGIISRGFALVYALLCYAIGAGALFWLFFAAADIAPYSLSGYRATGATGASMGCGSIRTRRLTGKSICGSLDESVTEITLSGKFLISISFPLHWSNRYFIIVSKRYIGIRTYGIKQKNRTKVNILK